MTDKANKIIIFCLFVGVFLCFGLIAHQYIRLESLQARLDVQADVLVGNKPEAKKHADK